MRRAQDLKARKLFHARFSRRRFIIHSVSRNRGLSLSLAVDLGDENLAFLFSRFSPPLGLVDAKAQISPLKTRALAQRRACGSGDKKDGTYFSIYR